MQDASMHFVLSGTPVPNRYKRALAQDGMFELWGPQLEAIQKGLLETEDPKHFVISIPTGAGKTLLAELSILAALGSDSSGWAMYVAPSRALVAQVKTDLRRRLQGSGIKIQTVLAGAEASVALGDEIDLIQTNRTVTVTTPRKLDSYYRNSRQIFDNCRLLVVDEIHKLSESDRGALLESLLTRFLVHQPSTRLVLMSGVMTNAEELVSWLGTERTRSVVARRRPARQVRGVAVRQSPPLLLGKPRSKKGKVVRKVQFEGGVVLVHDSEDLIEPIEVALPGVFRGYYSERQYGSEWYPDREETSSAITTHAINLAETMMHAPGTILVFMHNTLWVESSARKFGYVDKGFVQERLALAEFLKLELGDDHDLPKLSLRGVAYHHARLPSSVQRAVEYALENGWLKVVFATSTLREGINTSATTVIVAGDHYYDSKRNQRVPMSETDFENLAGRAGRPGVDTEGRVILIPGVLAQAQAVGAGSKYLLAGDSARRVQSQLGPLMTSVQEVKSDFLKLSMEHQRFLLGLVAADLSHESAISTFIARSFWSWQEEDEREVRRVVAATSLAFQIAQEQVGEARLVLASRLGLSLTSAEILYEAIAEKSHIFSGQDSAETTQDGQLLTLLEISLRLSEIKQRSLAKPVNPAAHLDPVRAWINGESYQSILMIGRVSGIFKQSAKIGEAVQYCADVSLWLSWAFGAAYAVIETMIEDVDPFIALLPLLIKHGVSSAPAAYASLLGVADRHAAQTLGTRFLDTEENASLSMVANWLDAVDLDDIFPAREHFLRADLVRRQTSYGGRRPMPYEFASIRAFATVKPGSILTIIILEDAIYLEDKGQYVAEVVGSDLQKVRSFADSSRGQYTAIVISARRHASGSVVLIRS